MTAGIVSALTAVALLHAMIILLDVGNPWRGFITVDTSVFGNIKDEISTVLSSEDDGADNTVLNAHDHGQSPGQADLRNIKSISFNADTRLGGPSFSLFVLGLLHVTLIELRLALISYQDYHMSCCCSLSQAARPAATGMVAPSPCQRRSIAIHTCRMQPTTEGGPLHPPRAASCIDTPRTPQHPNTPFARSERGGAIIYKYTAYIKIIKCNDIGKTLCVLCTQ